jgi:hypothetical protein
MMNDTVWATLNGLDAGELQTNGTIMVLPLFDPVPRTLTYITLNEALRAKTIRVSEISASGSVPHLDVENGGSEHVLLFDGEEVAGAKQNRVFNTSILVAAKSEVRVPVSCTERGRWAYRERDFRPSGNVMAAKMRARKMEYVQASLEASHSYAGEQGSVWRDVDELHADFGSSSGTAAMADAFRARKSELDRFVDGSKVIDRQVGMIVSVDGKLMGMDYLSSPSAFRAFFPKLIRSYATEALFSKPSRREWKPDWGDNPRLERAWAGWLERMREERKQEPDPADQERDLPEELRRLLLDADSTTESLHRSVGMGKDYRYKSSKLVGTALVAEGEVVHMGLLAADDRRGRTTPRSGTRPTDPRDVRF